MNLDKRGASRPNPVTRSRLSPVWMAPAVALVLAGAVGYVGARTDGTSSPGEGQMAARPTNPVSQFDIRLLQARGVDRKVALANDLAQKGRWAQARKAVEAALASAPEHEEALRLLARITWSTGDYATARETLLRLVKRFPEDAGILKNLAWCHHKLGKTFEALETAQRALKANPGDAGTAILISDLAEDLSRSKNPIAGSNLPGVAR